VRIKSEGYRCMPAPHAFYSKMLAERTASRNVFVLFYFIYLWSSVKVRVVGRRSCPRSAWFRLHALRFTRPTLSCRPQDL